MEALNAVGKTQGWRLVTTIDNGTAHPYWDIAGIGVPDQQAKRFVLAQAKTGSKTHQQVMQLLLQSRTKAKK